MKFRLSCLWAALLCGTTLHAQTATQPNEGLILTHDAVANPTQPFSLKWHADLNAFYFILQCTDLTEGDWTYFPYAVIGANGVEGVDFDNNSNQLFLRLYYTDDVDSPPSVLDHDGDGIRSGEELLAGSDPFDTPSLTDSDNDGMPDYWEMYYFGGLSHDGTADTDGDGLSDLLEWKAKTDPTRDDASVQSLRDEFSYDDRGWLSNYKLALSNERQYTADEEGNLTSHQ